MGLAAAAEAALPAVGLDPGRESGEGDGDSFVAVMNVKGESWIHFSLDAFLPKCLQTLILLKLRFLLPGAFPTLTRRIHATCSIVSGTDLRTQ